MINKAALLAVLATTLLLPAAVVPPATANAQTTTASRQSPQLVVEAISPDVPREPTTEIKISGSFTNTGTEALANLRIRMRYSSQPFARRADMAAYQSGQEGLQPTTWNQLNVPQVAPSAKAPWEFVSTPQRLGLTRFGVYPVMIEVLDPIGQQLAVQRTFVAYMPKDVKVPRTRLAMVLPLIDQPRRADDRTFVSDGLPASLADGKRLGNLLEIARDTSSAKGLTWVVDPALLDDVRALGRAYTLRTKDKSENRPANAAAAKWLDDLRTALAKPPVVATPYGDPDVAALAHNGVDDVTGTGIDAAKIVTRETLGRDVLTDVNWPVNGLIDYDGLDLLSTGDVATVLLNPLNLPPAIPPATTPDASATVESVNGPITALVTDTALGEIIGAETSAPGAALMNRQRFIAETAMISSEPVTTARTVIGVPPRRWDPDPAYVTGLAKTAATLPWLAPATLDAIKRGKGVPTPRTGLTYTDQDRRKELAKPYVGSVKRVAARADLTAAVTTEQDLDVFDLAVLRLASSAWRDRAETATPYVKQVGTAVDARIGKISITGTEQTQIRTLAGKNGDVPITVHNGLGQDVDANQVTVRLKVTSDQPRLLKIESYEAKDDPIVLRGGQNRTIRVPMTATTTASGQTTVTVQLTTADGRNYGKPVELTVRTTGYTGIALVIVGAALLVMLAAVIMRVLRRRGTRRASAATVPPRRASAPAGTES
ncbi:DUF6049 family protein [Streptosporangium minutum]|uniref:Glycoprotein n=1 Tax=Streptosporangium minutum TaxID=569862 RepID=A0A243RSY9_9ACTN|nr:DUF6049 family protein [Streptosporangium minutum]OUC98122.1 hypothetical protein CA984_08070 [Streptosporangium minutum]